jgi:hypothetical protein
MISMSRWGWGKAAFGRDGVIVPHAQVAPMHAVGLVIIGEGEVVAGVEPAVVGMADPGEGAQFDHGVSPRLGVRGSVPGC